MAVVNTRNRPKHEKVAEGGVVAAVIEITDACQVMEKLNDLPEARSNKRVSDLVEMAIKHAYQAADILENTTYGPPTEELFSLQRDALITRPPVPAEDGKPYVDEKGKVDSHRLYQLGHQVGPWECDAAVCWECPKAKPKDRELQHKECLEFYLVEQAKKVIIDELLAGVPYTRQELKDLSRKDLLTLAKALGVNRFKIKSQTNSALISHIFDAQEMHSTNKKAEVV